MTPKISVIMTVHNGVENYPHGTMRRALDSTLNEEHEIELIVCDDGSTDETRDVIAEYLKLYAGRIITVSHHDRRGAAAGYQSAAELATGAYCILQSCRSWYEPGALKEMSGLLDTDSGIGFAYGQTRYHGYQISTHVPPGYSRYRFFDHFDSLFGYMYRREALGVCRYESYFEREGRMIDICDYDFIMQLIVRMGYTGYAMQWLPALNYYYSGTGQMTNLVHKYQKEIDGEFSRRWERHR